MPGFLFDSHALLAFFQGERGAETVLKFLKETNSKGQIVIPADIRKKI